MLASMCAGGSAFSEDAAFDGDGLTAYGVSECFPEGERYPLVEPFEFGEHGFSRGSACRGIGLDCVQALERGLQGVALVPEQGHAEVGALVEVELELAAQLAVGQRPLQGCIGVAALGKAIHEVRGLAPVRLELHVDIDVVWFECATGKRAEYIQLSYHAHGPFRLAFIERSQGILQEQQRAFSLHEASVALSLA